MIEPRRVLHVHNSADIYGASRMLLRWLKGLDHSRFEPLVVMRKEGPLRTLIEAEGIEVILHPRAQHHDAPGVPILEDNSVCPGLSRFRAVLVASDPAAARGSGPPIPG
jgi:hypothetical protein